MSENSLRALPRDVPNYHTRQAAHLRALADNSTTIGIKQRLLEEAERHERAAAEVEDLHAELEAG